MLGSSWVTVTDDMQYFFDNPTAGGMTITPDASGDGTYTTDTNEFESIVLGFISKITNQATYANYIVGPPPLIPVMPLTKGRNVVEPSQNFGPFAATNTPSPAAVYTLGGTDAALLTIDSATAVVTANSATSVAGKPSYSFTVTATNGLGSDLTTVTLAIVEAGTGSADNGIIIGIGIGI
jgi:hypothetical protein